jgi:hypothetical protein
MLSILDGDPKNYKSWAESYFERPINLELVQRVCDHKPLSDEFVHSLNPTRDLGSLATDIQEIGYPD